MLNEPQIFTKGIQIVIGLNLHVLEDKKIAAIAVVCRYPGSRVCSQFNKENMVRELL